MGLVQGGEVGMVAHQRPEGTPQVGGQVQLQELARGTVVGAQATPAVEGEDGGGEMAEHGLQVGLLLLQLGAVPFRFVAGAGQAPGHVVEGVEEGAQFVVARLRQGVAVVAGGHRAGAQGEQAQGLHEAPRQVQRGPGGEEKGLRSAPPPG